MLHMEWVSKICIFYETKEVSDDGDQIERERERERERECKFIFHTERGEGERGRTKLTVGADICGWLYANHDRLSYLDKTREGPGII